MAQQNENTEFKEFLEKYKEHWNKFFEEWEKDPKATFEVNFHDPIWSVHME